MLSRAHATKRHFNDQLSFDPWHRRELKTKKAPTGAVLYASGGSVEAHNASFESAGSGSILAVQITSDSSMKALSCLFKGWMGSYVVLAGGDLEMDMCDFKDR